MKKKIKVVLSDNDTYVISLNDENKNNVVFECNTRAEWTKYLRSLKNPPKYIVVSKLVDKL